DWIGSITADCRQTARLSALRYDGAARSEIFQTLEEHQREPPAGRAVSGQGSAAQTGSRLSRSRRRTFSDRVAVEGTVRSDAGGCRGTGARSAGADPGLR